MGKLWTRQRGELGADRLIIAVSGLPGSGKTTLARGLADATGGRVLGFGNYVRGLAALRGRPDDREELQDLGDAAVAANPAAFLADAIATAGDDWDVLILDGLRHRALLAPLRAAARERGARFFHIHLALARAKRLARLLSRGVGLEAARAADAHHVEADGRSALAKEADLCVDGALPPSEVLQRVMNEVARPA